MPDTQTQQKRQLVVFDMDDTLITNNKWVDINSFLGISGDDDYRLYMAFKNGDISYAEWMTELDTLYDLENKHVTRNEIVPILQQVQLREGAKSLIDHLHRKGYITAIFTGSFVITAHTIADQLGIHHVVANTSCVFDENDELTGIHSRGTESAMKNAYLLELCSALNIEPTKDCYVVGDSIYDQPMFLTTGKGITFNEATDELKDSALYSVDSFADIQKLLAALPLIAAGCDTGSKVSHIFFL